MRMRAYDRYLEEHGRMVQMLRAKGKDLWRVQFKDSNTLEVLFIGLTVNDESGLSTVEALGDLPEWMQRRIAALNIFGDDYPTDYVDGVGRRINRTTYYLEE